MNKIKLDGKNNIFDSAYVGLPENNAQGHLSEEERQKIVKEINEKVTYDFYNKPALSIKRSEESDYTIDMTKSTRPDYKNILYKFKGKIIKVKNK